MLAGFIKRHNKLLLLGIVLGVLGTIFFQKYSILIPFPNPTRKIAIVDKPTLSDIPQVIQEDLSFGLTSILPSGLATPAAISSYEISDSGDKYTINLKQDLFWHDGKPFTSEDINYNFADVEIKPISDYQVEFKLTEPYAPFATTLSQPLFRQKKSGLFLGRTTLIGLGEAKMTKMRRNGHLITEIHLKKETENLIYKFYTTQGAAITAFKLGEVDEILELSSPGILSSWPNTIIEKKVHKNRYVALFFNTQDPYLSSKTLRQTLTYAISKKQKNSIRALGPVSPDSFSYNPQVKPYEHNLETARKLLEEDKQDRQNYKPKLELTTTLPHLGTAEQIKSQWIELGIDTDVKVVSFIPDEFQILLIAQESPPDPDQYSLWHSTQATNLTRYDDPKVDKLLEEGRQTLDIKERTKIYQDFQRFLLEDIPAAFLYHHTTYNIKRS